MTDFLKQKENTDDDLIFADEDYDKPAVIEEKGTWKILIADDEEEVHNVTKMVLDDYRFEGRSLTFLHAYSGRETERMMREHHFCYVEIGRAHV